MTKAGFFLKGNYSTVTFHHTVQLLVFFLQVENCVCVLYLLQPVLYLGEVRGQLAPASLQMCELGPQPGAVGLPQVEQLIGSPGC